MFLDNTDIPLLRDSGFQIGLTGYVWFGTDSIGELWKVEVADNGLLLFAPEVKKYIFGRPAAMEREDFDLIFKGAPIEHESTT